MGLSIDEQIEEARLAVESVLQNKPLQRQLKTVGFTLEKVTEGKIRYEKVRMMRQTMKQGYGSQYASTDSLYAAQEKANQLYKKHIKVARIAIPKENRNVWSRLELAGTRQRSLTGWLRQAEGFYANVQEASPWMTAYGVSQEELMQAEAMVQAVAAARVRQNDTRHSAKQGTQQRNEALAALNAWKREYKQAIRYAFHDNKQQMEASGAVVFS